MLPDIDYNNYSVHEVIKLLQDANDPKLKMLIHWLCKASEFDNACYNTRLALADAERAAEHREKGKVYEPSR